VQKDHLEILLADIRGKFDLVIEGHDALRQEIRETRQELNEKIELNSLLVKGINKKIDDVATDLAAHRADTESHSKGYNVSEK
jgi:nitrate reductase NapAB chaperone NapD